MFIQRNTKRQGDREYHSTLLVECYREEGKVKKRTLLNLSSWSEKSISLLERMLKGEELGSLAEVEVEDGRGYGALFVIAKLCEDLGIAKALGSHEAGPLVLLMTAARVVIQGSKLACARWACGQATREVLGIEPPGEDELYAAMDWLHSRQPEIEDAIWSHRRAGKTEAPLLFLYDVTSSYLEGERNELAAYGYNRDGKRGKRQVVLGLLCDREGFAVSCEVFPGSTQDLATFSSQVRKVSSRFGAERVVLVGDKGMIRSAQIEELEGEGFSYITSISKPEIEALASSGVIQLSLFDREICEICEGKVRYILRRNPKRAEEAGANRRQRLEKALSALASEASSLSSSQRKDPRKAYDRMVLLLAKLRVSRYVRLALSERELSFSVDEEALARACALDGCYCIKTDLRPEEMGAEEIHDRYRDLALVEQAFRDLKTAFLEIRPLNHRKATRTRAHAFICMLALLVTQEMRRRLKGTDATLEHVIRCLDRIQIVTLRMGDASQTRIVAPDPEQKAILNKLGIRLPKTPGKPVVRSTLPVGTKSSRKSA